MRHQGIYMLSYNVLHLHEPHAGAVKVHQKPLRGVEGKRLCVFYAIRVLMKFRTDEGSASVSCVNVHPDLFLLTCDVNDREEVNTTEFIFIALFYVCSIWHTVILNNLHLHVIYNYCMFYLLLSIASNYHR